MIFSNSECGDIGDFSEVVLLSFRIEVQMVDME